MQIGQFARATGVSSRMLRHWEKEGLLLPAGRGANGYREYDESQAGRASQIHRLIQAGLPARSVGVMFDALTDAGGVSPNHLESDPIDGIDGSWERMCRCANCIEQRRSALHNYLDELEPVTHVGSQEL